MHLQWVPNARQFRVFPVTRARDDSDRPGLPTSRSCSSTLLATCQCSSVVQQGDHPARGLIQPVGEFKAIFVSSRSIEFIPARRPLSEANVVGQLIIPPHNPAPSSFEQKVGLVDGPYN